MTYSLVGMFYLRDCVDAYSTGEIVAQVQEFIYLLQPDNMKGTPVQMPLELMALGDMTEISQNGIPAMSLFHTRAELDAYVEWMDAPAEPRVMSIVPKAKEE